jgi:hypothetical protein
MNVPPPPPPCARYFILLNSSVKGPFYPAYLPPSWHWTHAFMARFRDDVHAVSSSLVCLPEADAGERRPPALPASQPASQPVPGRGACPAQQFPCWRVRPAAAAGWWSVLCPDAWPAAGAGQGGLAHGQGGSCSGRAGSQGSAAHLTPGPHPAGGPGPRLESWAFALDTVGLQVAVEAGVFHIRSCKLCSDGEGIVVGGEYGITAGMFKVGCRAWAHSCAALPPWHPVASAPPPKK